MIRIEESMDIKRLGTVYRLKPESHIQHTLMRKTALTCTLAAVFKISIFTLFFFTRAALSITIITSIPGISLLTYSDHFGDDNKSTGVDLNMIIIFAKQAHHTQQRFFGQSRTVQILGNGSAKYHRTIENKDSTCKLQFVRFPLTTLKLSVTSKYVLVSSRGQFNAKDVPQVFKLQKGLNEDLASAHA